MSDTMTVNDAEFRVIKLLGKACPATDGTTQYALKQSRHFGLDFAFPTEKRCRFMFCTALQTVKKASQSLRPQAQTKWESFSPAACTSEKILLGSQTCELCAAGVQ